MRTTNGRRRAYALGAVAALAVLLSFGSANAATFTIVGGSSYVLPSTFNPAGSVATTTQMTADGIVVGATITKFTSFSSGQGLFVSPENLQLTFTFMGKEAGDLSLVQDSLQFISFNTPIFNTDAFGSTISGSYDVGSDPGLVPVKFADLSAFAQIINGGFASNNTAIGFLVLPSDPSVAYALFDDPNRRHPDGDFDDMIVRITAVGGEVPLPGALPLFVSGLGALGVLGWRRKRKPAA